MDIIDHVLPLPDDPLDTVLYLLPKVQALIYEQHMDAADEEPILEELKQFDPNLPEETVHLLGDLILAAMKSYTIAEQTRVRNQMKAKALAKMIQQKAVEEQVRITAEATRKAEEVRCQGGE